MAYQHHLGWPMFHPFTCSNRGDGNHPIIGGDEGILVPTPDGWRCPFCEYTQDWAWDGMFVEYPAQVTLDSTSQSQRFFGMQRVGEELEKHLCRTVAEYHRVRPRPSIPMSSTLPWSI